MRTKNKLYFLIVTKHIFTLKYNFDVLLVLKKNYIVNKSPLINYVTFPSKKKCDLKNS